MTTSQDIKTPPAEKAGDSGRLIKQLKAVVGNRAKYIDEMREALEKWANHVRQLLAS